ncbi:MAG TPA: hypothetical protein VM582_02405, partial [Candidatus Thermoplasmatota archaeon]|nr:hypothetical protein [Candidatus Thermoplasmatota archaeon]
LPAFADLSGSWRYALLLLAPAARQPSAPATNAPAASASAARGASPLAASQKGRSAQNAKSSHMWPK